MVSDGDQPFEGFIRSRTGADFVERRWLRQSIESALESESGRFVLVTGEPGAGKTSLMCGLADEHPDWLRYFVGQNDGTSSATGDVMSFLLAVGHQFAWQRPEAFERQHLEVIADIDQRVGRVGPGGKVVGLRVSDVRVSPFLRTARLKLTVKQRAKRVDGWLTAAEIGSVHLEPRLQDPVNFIHLALIDPARVLLEKNPDARIVILLDSLDSATQSGVGDALLDLLSDRDSVGLPANVRVVITSRQDEALDLLSTGRGRHLEKIQVVPTDERVRADLTAYARRALAAPAVERAIEDEGMIPDQFHRRIAAHASGNFQYLASYARALNDAVRDKRDDLVAELLRLDSFPSDLAGIYARFAAIARADIKRLGEQEIEYPLSDTGKVTSSWEGVGQPVLGVLTVAREPLSLDQLIKMTGVRVERRSVRNVLDKLSWLLDHRDDKRYAFYHASIGEFLASDRAYRDCYYSWVDETDWHKRIVRYYRGTAESWGDVEWSAVDRYGLAYLAWHAVRCRAEDEDPVKTIELACGGLRRASRAAFGSDQHFLRQLDLLSERAIDQFPLDAGLPAVLYLSVVRRQILRGVRGLAPAVLGLLARLGRAEEALEHLAALPPSLHQFEAALEIVTHNKTHREDLLELAIESALAVPTEEIESLGEGQNPLKRVAQVLAPHDLDRALQLWERGNATDRHGSEDPDPVYRAAANATSDVAAASRMVASICGDKAGAYLDLAARANPAEALDLLRLAEECLPASSLADRMRGRARLAAAWAQADPDNARRNLAAVIRDAAQSLAQANRAGKSPTEAARDAKEPAERTKGVVQAATELAGYDYATAKTLLGRLAAAEINGFTDDAFLRAAALWVDLGDLGQARVLLDRLLNWGSAASYQVDASTVITRFDPAEALRMLEQTYATIGPSSPGEGGITRTLREVNLAAVAVELARYDPRRAVAVASQITSVNWSSPDYDRYSTLARIAHRRLDTGDPDTGQAIVAQILRSAELTPKLADQRRPGPYRPVVGTQRAEQPRTTRDRVEHQGYVMNHTGHWRTLRDQRFYRDPAELMRAMTPDPEMLGTPYCLARTIRVFAESIADHDLQTATKLVHALSNSEERAIGTAALLKSATSRVMTESAGRLRAEFSQALDDMPRFDWLADNQDNFPFAYVRPDHRARFEAAIRLIPCDLETGVRLLREADTGYLEYAFNMSCLVYASFEYGRDVKRGTLDSPFKQVHEQMLAGPPATNVDQMVGIARSMTAFHEFLIAPQRRRGAAVSIDDPVYAALRSLAESTDVRSVSDAFIERVRDLLPGDRLPAAAGLVSFAAGLWPDNDRIRQLAAEVITASEGREAQRAVTLLQLARSPVLGSLVNPVDLLSETRHQSGNRLTREDKAETVIGLFPILIKLQPPTAALRLLHDSVAENWSTAMALLEQAASPLSDVLGASIANQLLDAIQRALACTSPDGTAPAEINGVKVGQAL